jgi:hypothetical protein
MAIAWSRIPGRRVEVWRRPLVEKENVSRQMNEKPLRLWVIQRRQNQPQLLMMNEKLKN